VVKKVDRAEDISRGVVSVDVDGFDVPIVVVASVGGGTAVQAKITNQY